MGENSVCLIYRAGALQKILISKKNSVKIREIVFVDSKMKWSKSLASQHNSRPARFYPLFY